MNYPSIFIITRSSLLQKNYLFEYASNPLENASDSNSLDLKMIRSTKTTTLYSGLSWRGGDNVKRLPPSFRARPRSLLLELPPESRRMVLEMVLCSPATRNAEITRQYCLDRNSVQAEDFIFY